MGVKLTTTREQISQKQQEAFERRVGSYCADLCTWINVITGSVKPKLREFLQEDLGRIACELRTFGIDVMPRLLTVGNIMHSMLTKKREMVQQCPKMFAPLADFIETYRLIAVCSTTGELADMTYKLMIAYNETAEQNPTPSIAEAGAMPAAPVFPANQSAEAVANSVEQEKANHRADVEHMITKRVRFFAEFVRHKLLAEQSPQLVKKQLVRRVRSNGRWSDWEAVTLASVNSSDLLTNMDLEYALKDDQPSLLTMDTCGEWLKSRDGVYIHHVLQFASDSVTIASWARLVRYSYQELRNAGWQHSNSRSGPWQNC